MWKTNISSSYPASFRLLSAHRHGQTSSFPQNWITEHYSSDSLLHLPFSNHSLYLWQRSFTVQYKPVELFSLCGAWLCTLFESENTVNCGYVWANACPSTRTGFGKRSKRKLSHDHSQGWDSSKLMKYLWTMNIAYGSQNCCSVILCWYLIYIAGYSLLSKPNSNYFSVWGSGAEKAPFGWRRWRKTETRRVDSERFWWKNNFVEYNRISPLLEIEKEIFFLP